VMGTGLDGSLTGTSRLEVILVGVIVVAAVVLLLARYLRGTDRKRRKSASVYFDKNAANKGAAGRDTSTGTAVYPSTGSPVPQPMAPSFAAPRRGGSPQDGSQPPGRPAASTGAPRSPTGPGAGTSPVYGTPVRSPVLDPLPPFRTEGLTMPADRSARPDPTADPSPNRTASPQPGPPSSGSSLTSATSATSARTAVPANLLPLTPPPPTTARPEATEVTDAPDAPDVGGAPAPDHDSPDDDSLDDG